MEDKPFTGILINLLNPDNMTRQKAEVIYKEALEDDVDGVVLNLVGVMNNHCDQGLVTLSGILLKRNFELYWKNMSRTSQETVKRLILERFSSNYSYGFLKVASDVISKLAICVRQNSENWSGFSHFLLRCISSSEDSQIFAGFKILSEIFAYYFDELGGFKEKLYQSFLKNFFHLENEIKTECCLCFVQVISVLSTADTKYFIGLLQALFKSILSITSSPLVEKVLASLRDLAETEPMFLKNRLIWCLQLSEGLIKSSLNMSCKYLGLEFLLVLTESYPSLILASSQTVFGYLELFRLTFEEVSGIAIDPVDIDYEKLILGLVARSVKALRGTFAQMILEYLSVNTHVSWKFKYFSILLLGEAAVEMFGTALFEPLMKYVLENMLTGSEKVHLACLKTFKKFIQKFMSRFTGKYSETIENSIKSGFNSQDLAIVQESLEVFVEFLKNLHNYEISPETQETFLVRILGYLPQETIQETVLKTIEAASDKFKRSVPWFFDQCYPALIHLISTTPKLSVKVSAINTLISLRKTTKRKSLIAHLPEIFQILQRLTDDFSSELFKTCVLENWKLIVRHFGSEFSVYLGEVVPGLLVYISNEREDIEEHLETLLVIIESTQESFIAFLNATTKIVLDLIVYDVSDTIRALACSIGAVLVELVLRCSSSDNKEGVFKFSKQFFVAICNVCVYEQDIPTLIEMLQSLQKIVSAPGQTFLSRAESETLSEMLVQILHSQSTSPQLRQTASQVLSTMFKTHTGFTVHLLDFIYSNLVDKYLSSNSITEKLFALSIFSDILSVVGNLILPEKLEKVLTVLLGYAKSTERKLSIEAIKGLVEGAKALDGERFKLYAEVILKTLESIVVTNAQKRSGKKVFEWAVAAVCLMVNCQEGCLKVEMVLPWIAEFLPVEKVVVAGRAGEIFVGYVTEMHFGLVRRDSVLNALVRISASSVCKRKTFDKIKSCIAVHLKSCGVEELYAKVPELHHQYLNKLLQ